MSACSGGIQLNNVSKLDSPRVYRFDDMFGVNKGVVGGVDGAGEFEDGGLSENVCDSLRLGSENGKSITILLLLISVPFRDICASFVFSGSTK